MEGFYHKLILSILAVLVYVVKELWIASFMEKWRERIKIFIDTNASDTDDDEKKSKRQAELIKKRGKDLYFITGTIAKLEIIIFSVLTIFVFYFENSPLKIFSIIGGTLGVWLTWKILASHIPWSDVVAGKAYYHASLLGTLANIAAGIVIGFLLHVAWFAS